MTDDTRKLVHAVLSALRRGDVGDVEALEMLQRLDIAPRVAGILLRQTGQDALAAA